jgi:hypothetical protein
MRSKPPEKRLGHSGSQKTFLMENIAIYELKKGEISMKVGMHPSDISIIYCLKKGI